MHEASITESIVLTVLDILDREPVAGTVTGVGVTVGVTQGLVPESMQMFFDMAKPGTALEHAELKVHAVGIAGRCPVCDEEHELDMPVMFCPSCGGPMDLIRGNEIMVTEIEVEDDEDTGE